VVKVKTRASEAKGPFPGGKRVGSWGKKVKVKANGLRSMGLLFLIDGIKENPTHFKEVDGVRFFRRVLKRLAYKDTTVVGWVATEEREQQIQGWEAEAFDFRAAACASASY